MRSPEKYAVSTLDNTPDPMRGAIPAVMWAVFLGCSWTWVIGMYLPVILLRDYGFWGWVAFAVPNVVGAGAMGWVLRNPQVSRTLVQKHATACLIFSQITVGYQIYMVTAYTGLIAWPILLAVSFAFWLYGRGGGTKDNVTAVAVWIASLAAFGYMQWRGWLWLDVSRTISEVQLTRQDLMMFIPASVFGFVLCPYLDLTFHRARQATDTATGRAAFTLGFGVVFFSMIVFSLAYAGALFWPFGNVSETIHLKVWQVFRWHLLIQAAFTIAVHWRAMETTSGSFGFSRKLVLALTAGVLALATLKVGMDHVYEVDHNRVISVAELVYRLFLLLYGTVFPAYVLLCMTPTYRQVSHKARLYLFIIVAAISYPLACLAFIINRSLWVIPILAVMVAGRVVVEVLPKAE